MPYETLHDELPVSGCIFVDKESGIFPIYPWVDTMYSLNCTQWIFKEVVGPILMTKNAFSDKEKMNWKPCFATSRQNVFHRNTTQFDVSSSIPTS